MIEGKQYSLNDFNSIHFDNFQYKLDKSIYDILNNLSQKLGIKQVTEKKEYKSIETKPKIVKSDEQWEHMKAFKPTVIIENKEGSMNEIRICLNKISNKNYETNKTRIITLMESLIENKDELEKIANNIFDIASTNKFFSEIYAELYKSLIEKFSIFRDVLNSFLEKFTDSIKNIQYIDQKDNYDAFCKYNKMNDSRKATSVFIVNLVKKNVLEKDFLSKIIIEIQSFLLENIDIENKINEIDEITENIFLLVTESHEFMKINEDWNSNIINNIKKLSILKVKEKKSLSSRAIFKYMDIMDRIK
jgi:mannose-6-phosphate isomerase class I